ncbi:hypothetical protein [Cereibacter sphaeroides]|uniref:hypothetical protein n=1 Tax=Cereibacter sphaeroides TaxID=1063 RepID=UPI00313D9612
MTTLVAVLLLAIGSVASARMMAPMNLRSTVPKSRRSACLSLTSAGMLPTRNMTARSAI